MRTTNQLAAEKILVAHQRKDIGSCLCGWGVNDGHLGHSHAAHVVDVLTAAGLIGGN